MSRHQLGVWYESFPLIITKTLKGRNFKLYVIDKEMKLREVNIFSESHSCEVALELKPRSDSQSSAFLFLFLPLWPEHVV